METKSILFKKKERLYEEGNMGKWGMTTIPSNKPDKLEGIKVILPKETEDLNRLRIRYGLRNFQLYEEINRNFLRNNRYMGRHLLNYTRVQSNLTSELMMVWVDAQTQALGMTEGRSIQGVDIRAS